MKMLVNAYFTMLSVLLFAVAPALWVVGASKAYTFHLHHCLDAIWQEALTVRD